MSHSFKLQNKVGFVLTLLVMLTLFKVLSGSEVASAASLQTNYNLGDTIRAGDYSFTINQALVSYDFCGHKPDSGNIWLALEITMANNGSSGTGQSLLISDGGFFAYDDRGSAVSKAYFCWSNRPGKELPFWKNIAPGESETGWLIYEVPGTTYYVTLENRELESTCFYNSGSYYCSPTRTPTDKVLMRVDIGGEDVQYIDF